VLKKPAPLVCHAGGTNTLMIAPTRSGKGVSSIIPTCLSYPQSMIIFDPKGELFYTTSGYRRQFSTVLKFSPISKDTVRFNPFMEVDLTEQAFADIGLIMTNMFPEPKGGSDGASAFFDNMGKDLLTGLILHVLSSRKYPDEQKTISGVLGLLSQASAKKEKDEDGEDKGGAGDELLNEMMTSEHYDKFGNHCESYDNIVSNAAARCLSQHEKVRSDVFTTVFSKMGLFEDPYIKYVTGASDFMLQDFYDNEYPITLYLTVPFSDIDRVSSVFRLLINFILNKFSRGEATYGEVKLKHRILFLIDEFPVLGAFPFISKTMGILAGYGITFYIVVQALNQIIDLYGQNHTFLDNCKTVVVYAPGKVEDAEPFTKLIGQESVIKDSVSASGNVFQVLSSGFNESSQAIQRNLINADELTRLSLTKAVIINQNNPAYIAKKVVYYMDARFKDKAYSAKKTSKEELSSAKIDKEKFIRKAEKENRSIIEESINITEEGKCYKIKYDELVTVTGFRPPAKRKDLEMEIMGLPSYKILGKNNTQTATAGTSTLGVNAEAGADINADIDIADVSDVSPEDFDFDDPGQYFEKYETDEDMEKWVSPHSGGFILDSPPPQVVDLNALDAMVS
jgi:type IV secretion system protein VirD4